jgi:hypothetical protein
MTAAPCTICDHADRSTIDAALVAGRAVAAHVSRFGVSSRDVKRHRADHLPSDLIDRELARRLDRLGRRYPVLTETPSRQA